MLAAAAPAMSHLVGRLRALRPRAADWRPWHPGRDLLAGLVVALVALPLALGFGISSGAGAHAGIITAVIAGALAAGFGGSRVQVSGPTGAMTVVLLPIAAAHGTDGVLVVGLLAGVILLGLAYAGAGRLVHYLPVPVVEGFTVGIALIIALQQLPTALGVDVHGEKVLLVAGRAVATWLEAPGSAAPLIALTTITGILLGSRLRPTLPTAIVVVGLVTVVAELGRWEVPTIGRIPAGLPAPSLPLVPLHTLDDLLMPALAVAALAALESLLSATVADAMAVGPRHDPDRELLGQGLANLAVPFFGGIPATAAIARTAVNVRSGASTRLAAVAHAGILLAVVLLLTPWVSRIPLAALAGVLVATAFHMVRVSSLGALLRSTHGDAAALVVTAATTVLFDLVTAVLIGLVVAGFFGLRQTARSARLDITPLAEEGDVDREHDLLDQHIVAFRMDGPLLFAAAHDFLLELAQVADVRVVVLRMARMSTIDATGAHVLVDVVGRLERRGVTVLMSGLRPQHERVLRELGLHARLAHEKHLFGTTREALEHARLHASRTGHAPG